MSELSIRRLSATATDWPDPDQVPRMLEHVAAGRLEDAVRSISLPDGEWCVRRVDLAVRLDPERPASALETDWADRIVLALRQSLQDGSRDVVRYERGEDALDELLAGLALGQLQHAWAWRLVGLLQPDDPAPEEDPGALCLRMLGRLPHGVAGSVSRLVRRVGPAATHRLLGAAGWAEVAALAARESGVRLDPVAGPDPATPDESRPAAPPVASAPPSGAPPAPAERRARGLSASSYLVAALGGSGLRVAAPTRRHWAVLALAETDPGALRGADAPSLVRALAALLDHPVASGLGTPRAGRGPGATAEPRVEPDRAAGTAQHREAPPGVPEVRRPDDGPRPPAPPAARTATAGPPEPDPASTTDRLATHSFEQAAEQAAEPADVADLEPTIGAATPWGGLLFLLNTADDAGLPDALEEEPLLGRPTAWLLAQLGTRLVPAAEDDPAVLALGGLDPGLAAAQPSADEVTGQALDRCAARWVAATAARLRASASSSSSSSSSAEWPRSDEALVRRLARRHAVVVREPGWVEVRLRLDDVDLDVRRAGLDLDPGWVWWLGQVVRFGYE